MTWLMEILTIYLEEQLLIKYYTIKHLILLKRQNLIAIIDQKFSGGAGTSGYVCY